MRHRPEVHDAGGDCRWPAQSVFMSGRFPDAAAPGTLMRQWPDGLAGFWKLF